jgi:hypothetical protein
MTKNRKRNTGRNVFLKTNHALEYSAALGKRLDLFYYISSFQVGTDNSRTRVYFKNMSGTEFYNKFLSVYGSDFPMAEKYLYSNYILYIPKKGQYKNRRNAGVALRLMMTIDQNIYTQVMNSGKLSEWLDKYHGVVKEVDKVQEESKQTTNTGNTNTNNNTNDTDAGADVKKKNPEKTDEDFFEQYWWVFAIGMLFIILMLSIK